MKKKEPPARPAEPKAQPAGPSDRAQRRRQAPRQPPALPGRVPAGLRSVSPSPFLVSFSFAFLFLVYFLSPTPSLLSPHLYKYPHTPPLNTSNQKPLSSPRSTPPPLTTTRATPPRAAPHHPPPPLCIAAAAQRRRSPETSPEVAPRLFSSDRFLLIVPILFFSKPFRFSRSVFRSVFLLRNPRSDSFSSPI